MGSDRKQNDDSPGSGVLPGREQTSLWEKSCSAPPRSGGGLAGEITRLSHPVSKRLVWLERSAGKTPSFERGAPKAPLLHALWFRRWRGAAPAAPEARSRQGPGQSACSLRASLGAIAGRPPPPPVLLGLRCGGGCSRGSGLHHVGEASCGAPGAAAL